MKVNNLDLCNLKKKKINYREHLIKHTNLSISQITRLSYDLQSGSYSKFQKKLLKGKKKNIYFKNMNCLFKYLKSKNIKTILDFGTGEGIKLPTILKYKKQLVKLFACDVSFNRLCVGYNYLKKELKKDKLSKIFLFCNKDFELPFKSNSIDAVLTFGVFENMTNKKMNEMILELFRVSKKKLILVEPRKNNITDAELQRMKKFKLNFNLNKILKKNKMKFIEDTWNKSVTDATPYSIRIIDKDSKFSGDLKFYLKNENYPLKKINNFFYSKFGKIIPIINYITIFRSLKNLYYFK